MSYTKDELIAIGSVPPTTPSDQAVEREKNRLLEALRIEHEAQRKEDQRIRAENAALKARVERIEAAARDAALGRAVAEAAARFKDADDIALTEDVSIWEDDCHGGDSRTLLVIDDDQHALLADIAEAIAAHRAALEEP